MFASNPCPPETALLIPLLPGVARLGAWWARRLGIEDPWGWAMAALGWGWLTHAIGTLSGSFQMGLAVSSAAMGLAGWGLALRPEDRVGEGPWPWPAMAAGMAVVLGAVVWWDFYERYHTVHSHFAIANQICNGAFPPRDLYFPSGPLRYHYGADLLVASAMAILRLRVDVAYDLVTIACWGCLLALSWLLCSRALGIGGRWAWLILPLGAGMEWASPAGPGWPEPLAAWMAGSCDGRPAPGLPAFFFQAPWMAGLPLMLLGIRLVLAPRAGAWVALPWLACGLYNVTAAAAGGAATAAAALFSGPGAARRASAVAAAVALGLAAGPMGASAGGEAALVLDAGGPAGTAIGNAEWAIVSFGATLLGARHIGRIGPAPARAWAALLVAGSALGLGFLACARSGDIVKLAAPLHLGLNLGCVAMVGICRARWLAAASAGLLCAGSAWWGAWHAMPPGPDLSQRAMWLRDPGTSDRDLRRAVDFVRARIGPGEMVWAPRESDLVGALGGFPQPGLDPFAWGLGHARRDIERRAALLGGATPAALWEEGVRWVLLDGSRDAGLAGSLRAEPSEIRRFGRWGVLRLPRPGAPERAGEPGGEAPPPRHQPMRNSKSSRLRAEPAVAPRPSAAPTICSKSSRLRSLRAIIRSSTVPRMMSRVASTARDWPMRWQRAVAWSSTAGFHHGSTCRT